MSCAFFAPTPPSPPTYRFLTLFLFIFCSLLGRGFDPQTCCHINNGKNRRVTHTSFETHIHINIRPYHPPPPPSPVDSPAERHCDYGPKDLFLFYLTERFIAERWDFHIRVGSMDTRGRLMLFVAVFHTCINTT